MFGRKKKQEIPVWIREEEFFDSYERFRAAERYHFSIKDDANVSEKEKNEAEKNWAESKKIFEALYREWFEWSKEANTIPKVESKDKLTKNTIVSTGVTLICTFGPFIAEKFGYIIKRPTEWIPKHLFWRDK